MLVLIVFMGRARKKCLSIRIAHMDKEDYRTVAKMSIISSIPALNRKAEAVAHARNIFVIRSHKCRSKKNNYFKLINSIEVQLLQTEEREK